VQKLVSDTGHLEKAMNPVMTSCDIESELDKAVELGNKDIRFDEQMFKKAVNQKMYGITPAEFTAKASYLVDTNYNHIVERSQTLKRLSSRLVCESPASPKKLIAKITDI
jgi:hypothetical protein